MANQKHLTIEDRVIIETGLTNGSTLKSIADTLGKSPSTICKEIKLHSIQKEYSRPYMRKTGTYDFKKIEQCGFNSFCSQVCNQQQRIECKRRDRTVGVCNGCSRMNECRIQRKIYTAGHPHDSYE